MTSERERVLLEVFFAVAGPEWEKLLPELLEGVGEAAEEGGVKAASKTAQRPAADVLQRAAAEVTVSESRAEDAAPPRAEPETGESAIRTETDTAAPPAPAAARQSSEGQKERTGGSVWGKVASFTTLGTLPLARAIIGLFGGEEKQEPEPLVRFALPARRRFEAALADGRITEVDYDQYGAPRARRAATVASEAGSEATAGRTRVVAPQVTVQVQAMDSRSFLDRSEDIARAVREAMLNMHALNDVVGEL